MPRHQLLGYQANFRDSEVSRTRLQAEGFTKSQDAPPGLWQLLHFTRGGGRWHWHPSLRRIRNNQRTPGSGCVLVVSCMCLHARSVMSNSLQPRGWNPPGPSVHGDSPGKNTGVGCHFLLQGIFLTHELNLHLLHLLHGQASFYHCTTWDANDHHIQRAGVFITFIAYSSHSYTAMKGWDRVIFILTHWIRIFLR